MTYTKALSLLALAGLSITLLGCGQRQAARITSPSVDGSATDVDPAQRRRAVEAKDALFAQLSSRLMEVMGAEGPAGAIGVCSREASGIAAQVGGEHGVTIGRTAIKLRNSNNVAPEWAMPMIQRSADQPTFVNLAGGHVGALLPIKLKAICIVCHGEPEQLAEEVKTELSRLYPNDQATGFKEGDLRGWFWVDVPES